MKKLTLTIAIVLGIGIGAMAQMSGGGLFQRGAISEDIYFNNGGYAYDPTGGSLLPGLPNHGQSDNQDAPLGSGIALLLGMGGAYLVAKKRREE